MTTRLRAAAFAACMSFVGSWTAVAETVPQVTVTAPRPPTSAELAGDAVPDFVRSHTTRSAVIGQLTRWRNPVCPRAEGLGDAMDAFITARVRAIAEAVGAPDDESQNCRPNVVILFTLEPQKVLNVLLKQDARLLGFHYRNEQKRLAAFTEAIQGWYVTSTRNFRGVEETDDPQPLGDPTASPLTPLGKLHAGKVPPGEPGSRLDNYRSSQVIFVTIIADANRIKGMTIGSISDYITVLALSQARPSEGCSQLPSIMDLLASGCGADRKPDQLTAGDLAFLRALYHANLETPVEIEESNIGNAMLRAFKDQH
jgi:hypothetical protein